MKKIPREKFFKALERYAAGSYLSEALKAEGIRSESTFYKRCRDDLELLKAHEMADLQLSHHLHELNARDEERLGQPGMDVGDVRAVEVRIRSRQWRMSRLNRPAWGDQSRLDLKSEQLTTVVFRNYTGIQWEEAARQRALTGEPPPLLPGVRESAPVVDIGPSRPVEEPPPEERPTPKVAKLQGGKQTGEPLIRETPRRGRAIL